MHKTIAVCGCGPGLGQAVARCYAREGYEVVLVARRRQPLQALADQLVAGGGAAHVVTADLCDTSSMPDLAERIRIAVGDLHAIYYAPTAERGFVPAVDLTPERAHGFMPLGFYSFLALVQEFLPHMLEQGDGAILTAQGASTLRGLADMSGPGPSQAAQRNYLQSLQAEVADKGVYIGMLYIGAVIENSAFHTYVEQSAAAGTGRLWGPTVSPDYLANMIWEMHSAKSVPEATYPA